MSASHPIIAVTGSSGSGTTRVQRTFERIFSRLNLRAAFVSGDSFHRYTRAEMVAILKQPNTDKGSFNHFGLRANLLDELNRLFVEYGQSGTGRVRRYVHAEDEEDIRKGYPSGTFTPWEEIPLDTDLLFYEGLHGGLVAGDIDIAGRTDLLIGLAPIINLEWIQKIHRDTRYRGYSVEETVATILGRMEDYVRHIVPQFSRTDINFQRVPLVDTSNPFVVQDVPTDEESHVVIHFRKPDPELLAHLVQMIHNAFQTRPDTVVIPGVAITETLELIVTPMVERLVPSRN